MNSSTPLAQGQCSLAASATHGARTHCTRRRSARGFTLIEMLVSLAITLIMMTAVVTLFGVISESVSGARSMIEMSDRLRLARETIQGDLLGATATMNPPLSPETGEGYFEIIEGPANDNAARISLIPQPLFGDVDDVLMFTVRNRKAPFFGRGGGSVIESPLAEVIYFLVQNGPVIDATTTPITKLCTLYRRVLLISPNQSSVANPALDFFNYNDLSVQFQTIGTTPTLVANSLGDLTKRENRFGHYGKTTYMQHPFLMDLAVVPEVPWPSVAPNVPNETTVSGWPGGRPNQNAFLGPFNNARLGEDVLLTNVLAFDVQVWDPTAPVRVDAANPTVGLEPHDPGWSGGSYVADGAYVDLGYASAALSQFSQINPHIKPVPTSSPRFYDTWSLHYENDGIDQDGMYIDGGTNGLDDDSDGLVDERDLNTLSSSEFDTHPPYNVPLRGVRITIRVYEPNSKTVREAVVYQNFNSK